MEEFKYTEEEIKDLINWFKGKKLPKSIRIDQAIFIPDVERCITLMSEIVINKQNRTFESTADMLFKIKDLVEKFNNGEEIQQS